MRPATTHERFTSRTDCTAALICEANVRLAERRAHLQAAPSPREASWKAELAKETASPRSQSNCAVEAAGASEAAAAQEAAETEEAEEAESASRWATQEDMVRAQAAADAASFVAALADAEATVDAMRQRMEKDAAEREAARDAVQVERDARAEAEAREEHARRECERLQRECERQRAQICDMQAEANAKLLGKAPDAPVGAEAGALPSRPAMLALLVLGWLKGAQQQQLTSRLG